MTSDDDSTYGFVRPGAPVTRRTWPRQAFAAIAVLGMAACSVPGVNPVANGASPAPAAAGSAATPVHGGTFIMALEGDSPTFNPYINTDTLTLMPSVNIYETLILLDSELKPRPGLADTWDLSPDGLTYTFQLVKNATWHDGEPFTSADVKFTLDKLAPTHPRASAWWTPNVQEVTAPDNATIAIKLKQPFAPFMVSLGFPSVAPQIMPQHLYDNGDLKTNPVNVQPVGTGPFKFKEYVKGDHIELTRNNAYYRPGLPYLDRLVMRIVPDPNSRMLAFQKGDVDFVYYYLVLYDQVARYKADPKYVDDQHGGEAGATSEFVMFNLRNPFLGTYEVRKAIALAIDKDAIRYKALSGLGKTADTVIHSGLAWAFSPNVTKYNRDVPQANQLLDHAGHPRGADGTRFKLRLSWADGRDFEGLSAEVIRDQLRDVGIGVEITKMDRATFIDRVFMNWDFDMAHQLFGTGPDPTIGVTRFLSTANIKKASFVNAMGYSNPNVDKLLNVEVAQTDLTERADSWKKVQELVMQDLPLLPLFEQPVDNLYRSNFKDVILGPMAHGENHARTWMDPRR